MPPAAVRACPVCGEENSRTLIFSQRFSEPSAHGIHGGYDVVVCDRCGMGYALDPPAQAFFDDYYGALAKKDEMLDPAAGFAESAATIARNDHSLRNILPHAKTGARVLEVGCYTGYLLSRIAAAVPDALTVGLDPSSFAAAVGRQRHGLDIRVGKIFDQLGIGRFDVVIAMHVLEHVVDPGAFVDRLRRFLSTDGRLYVEVPDATGFRSWNDPREQRAEPYFEFNFEHINYFDPDSLTNLMRLHGYEPLEVAQQRSTLPVVAATFQALPLAPSQATLPELRRYVAESGAIEQTVAARIDALAQRESEIIVWGAGAHTQHLLGVGILDARRVAFFVDGNSALHGATLAGRTIVAPDHVGRNQQLPVLISSHRFEQEIAARIRAEGWSNEIVTLYEQGGEEPVGVPAL
jgi:SAM-dependent methyltransferase